MLIIDNKKNIRSFGRINGRGVLKNHEDFLNEKLPKYSINLDSEKQININDLFNNDNKNYFEIGCGYGESIAERAKNMPNINFIACETYTKGIINLIELIEKYNLKNIKIFNGDARLLLENIEDNNIDMLFLLFPDPWPKKKQNKRRIVSDDFLQLISQKMKNNAIFFFASDINSYLEWTLEKVDNNHNFTRHFNTLDDCKNQPEWWVVTKYQQKAIREGRESRFCEYFIKK